MKRNPWDILAGLALLLVLGLALVANAGCGTKREETQHREERADTVAVEKVRTERSTLAPDGTPFVEVTVTTRALEQTTRSEADTQIRGSTTLHAPEISAAVSAVVTAATGGIHWGQILGAVGLIAGPAAIALRESQSRKRADARAVTAKAEADEGWKLADERALALPPKPVAADYQPQTDRRAPPYDGDHA